MICVEVPPTASNRSIDELRTIVTDYSQPDEQLMTRSAAYVIDELAASSVYSVAIRTRNGFGFSDWTVDFYFETAPGRISFALYLPLSPAKQYRRAIKLFSLRIAVVILECNSIVIM